MKMKINIHFVTLYDFFTDMLFYQILLALIVICQSSPVYKLRKCCPLGKYYNLNTQECVTTLNTKSFQQLVKKRLMKVNVPSFSLKTGRLLKCPETEECVETITIDSSISHTLLPNGFLFDHDFGATFSRKDYCLETVGRDQFNVTLAVAFCLPESKTLSKCCPNHQYFDAIALKCLPYTNVTSVQVATTLTSDVQLIYKNDLLCSTLPEQFSLLTDSFLNRCRDLCIHHPTNCYSKRNFCIDHVQTTDSFGLSSFVCTAAPTKRCCKDKYYDEHNLDCSCTSAALL